MAMILSFVTAWILAAVVMMTYSVCSSQFSFVGRIRKALAAAGSRPDTDTATSTRISGRENEAAA
jgi:hypothetical protein